jgi:hypothetical protein
MTMMMIMIRRRMVMAVVVTIERVVSPTAQYPILSKMTERES